MATQVKVGTQWTNPDGRVWSITEIKPFGRCSIRSGMRFGEAYTRDVHRWIDEAAPAIANDVPAAYLRTLDDTGSLHVCAAGDPGAFPVFAEQVSA